MNGDHELIRHLGLEPEDALLVATRTGDALVAVTKRRFIVRDAQRVTLDLPIEDIRRVEFDVERGRPATLAVVPHSPSHEPQVLTVPMEQLDPVARMLAIVGERLGALE
jgi:hypothetical protein